MSDDYLSARATVEIDGAELSDSIEANLEEVVVDNSVDLPDMFVLVLQDPDKKVVHDAQIKIGSEVTISAQDAGSSSPAPLVTAEVTAIEGDYGPCGNRAVIRGYDKSHRLHRGKFTKTWQQVTDTDVVREIAQAAGIDTDNLEDSGETHDYLAQTNLSHWSFLNARANEIGFQLTFENGKLSFRRPPKAAEAPEDGDFSSEGDPRQLVYQKNLLEFRPRVTSAEQVSEVKVRGWDPVQKQPVLGSAPAGTTARDLSTNPAQMAQLFDSPTRVVIDIPLSAQAPADNAAKSIAESVGAGFAGAEGTALGSPKLKAGEPITVSAVSDDFNGKYKLSRTRHVFDERGYRTHLWVSGKQGATMLAASSISASSVPQAKIYGLGIGIVTGNSDSNHIGMVKVSLPWLDDAFESDWSRVAAPGAGPDSGFYWMPEVGDEVLVGFEFGDIQYPIVLGGLWNGVDKPPFSSDIFDHGKVNQKGMKSRTGHYFRMDDSTDKAGVEVATSDGNCVVSLDKQNGDVAVKAKSGVTIHITAESGAITIESQGDIKVHAAGNLSLQGDQGVALKSSGIVDVDGLQITLN